MPEVKNKLDGIGSNLNIKEAKVGKIAMETSKMKHRQRNKG